jgi:hypothetical protein
MLDMKDGNIVDDELQARAIVTDVDATSVGKTMQEIFTVGPNFFEAKDNQNLDLTGARGNRCGEYRSGRRVVTSGSIGGGGRSGFGAGERRRTGSGERLGTGSGARPRSVTRRGSESGTTGQVCNAEHPCRRRDAEAAPDPSRGGRARTAWECARTGGSADHRRTLIGTTGELGGDGAEGRSTRRLRSRVSA